MKTLICTLALALAGCAHHRDVVPDARAVEVRHESPPTRCHQVGPVTGRTSTATASREEALEDLRRDAANRGANYVVVKEWSAYGTAVTGVAFDCP